jgi:hypothetical protein
MYFHTLVFDEDLTVDLEISRKQPLERLRIARGTRMRAQMKPYVIETPDGLVEVADLFFEDGTATRQVPFACFRFAE